MKAWSKKMMAGTLAAAFLIGGAGITLQQNAAYAAATSADDTSAVQAAPGKAGGRGGDHGKGGFHGGQHVLKEAASVIGMDEAALRTELSQSKTLAQVAQEKAGLSEADLLQRLIDAQTQVIDEAVAAGKLTQDQADEQKASLSDRLKQQITNVLPAGDERGKLGGKGKGLGGLFGQSEQTAALLGMTTDELNTALQSGKSLAEIAQEHGVSRDQLILQLKNGLDESIHQYVDSKHQRQASVAGE